MSTPYPFYLLLGAIGLAGPVADLLPWIATPLTGLGIAIAILVISTSVGRLVLSEVRFHHEIDRILNQPLPVGHDEDGDEPGQVAA